MTVMETAAVAVREMDAEPFNRSAVGLKMLALQIGRIETNAEQVLPLVAERIKDYRDLSRYAGKIDAAKKDRALLRKQKDALIEVRKDIEATWNSPLETFRATVKHISAAYDEAIDSIDSLIKAAEDREKQEKQAAVQTYFNEKACDLVSLDRLFKAQWLNKTYKLTDIKAEINAAIAEIYKNIEVLEQIPEHGMTAKAWYLETLNMGAALRNVQTLKDNAAKLARERLEREERRREEQTAQNRADLERERAAASREARVSALAAEALDLGVSSPPAQPEQPQIYELTLKFSGTKKQLWALRKYMSDTGIVYEMVGP